MLVSIPILVFIFNVDFHVDVESGFGFDFDVEVAVGFHFEFDMFTLFF